jgi:hypothetical protein
MNSPGAFAGVARRQTRRAVYGVAAVGTSATAIAEGITTRHANRISNRHTAKEAASLSRLLVRSRLVHAMLLRVQALVRPKTLVISGHLGACAEMKTGAPSRRRDAPPETFRRAAQADWGG